MMRIKFSLLIAAFCLLSLPAFAQVPGHLSSGIGLQDESSLQGRVNQLNCVGPLISCASSGLTGTLTTALPADSKVRTCEIAFGSKTSTATAIATDDDVPFVCSNLTGSTLTVSSVECLADAANMTVDVVISGGSSILTGAVTCGNGTFAAATLSGTPTQANNGSLDVNIGTNASSAKYAVVRIKRTL